MQETTSFPTDLEACHRLLREQSGAIAEYRSAISDRDEAISERDAALAAKDALVAQQNQQLAEQKEKIAEYQLRLAAALQAAFRKRIERYLPDPNQLTIDFGNSPDVADAAEAATEQLVLEAMCEHDDEVMELRTGLITPVQLFLRFKVRLPGGGLAAKCVPRRVLRSRRLLSRRPRPPPDLRRDKHRSILPILLPLFICCLWWWV